MARREQGESPHGALTSEQRSQTPYSPLALRVVLIFGLSYVAPQLQTHRGHAPSSRLAQAKNQQQCGLFLLLSQLLRPAAFQTHQVFLITLFKTSRKTTLRSFLQSTLFFFTFARHEKFTRESSCRTGWRTHRCD